MVYLKSGSRIKTSMSVNHEWLLGGLIVGMGTSMLMNDYQNKLSTTSDELKIPITTLTFIVNSLNIDDAEYECYEYVYDHITNEFTRGDKVSKNPDHIVNFFTIGSYLTTSSSELYDHYVSNGGGQTRNMFSRLLKNTTPLIQPTTVRVNGKQVRGYLGVGVKL